MKRVNFILLVLIVIFIAWGKSSAEQPPGKVDYLSLFPPPLKGWKASDVTMEESKRELDLDINALFGGVEKKRLRLTRTYREINKHGVTVTIEIDTWDCYKDMLIPRSPDAKKELEHGVGPRQVVDIERESAKMWPDFGLRMPINGGRATATY